MKIEITHRDASNPYVWFNNCIGHTFEFERIENGIYDLGNGLTVGAEYAKIVTDEEKPARVAKVVTKGE